MTSGFTIHPLPGALDQPYTQIQCQANSGNCSPGDGYWSNYNFIPVTLGAPLTLVANGHLSNQAVALDNVSGGILDPSFLFRFYEVNGTTPVAVEMVSDAPEPSTYGLIGRSLAAAALLRKKLSSTLYLQHLTLGRSGHRVLRTDS